MPLATSAQELLPELVEIPAGPFLMGSIDGADDERPPHEVHLDEYLIATRPVSHRDYVRFVEETGYRIPAVYDLPLVATAAGSEGIRSFRAMCEAYAWHDGGPPESKVDHPVTLVRHQDAEAYCEWLSRVAARTVRLPTEAEWEKAARAGLTGCRYPWGDTLDRQRANFLSDPALRYTRGTSAPGAHPPNGFGLYDMAGNVWEWVQDWYDPSYYESSPRENPPGAPTGQLRVLRGGSWLAADVRMLTCAYRHKVPPDTYSYAIGFRVVCTL